MSSGVYNSRVLQMLILSPRFFRLVRFYSCFWPVLLYFLWLTISKLPKNNWLTKSLALPGRGPFSSSSVIVLRFQKPALTQFAVSFSPNLLHSDCISCPQSRQQQPSTSPFPKISKIMFGSRKSIRGLTRLSSQWWHRSAVTRRWSRALSRQ